MLPVAAGTASIIGSVVLAMLKMMKVRYAVKDDNGKKLLPHPYKPWSEHKGHEAEVEEAYRAYRAYENSREWLVLSLPIFWLFSAYASSLPFVSENIADLLSFGTAIAWAVGNYLYVSGYTKSAAGRMTGFKIRTLMFRIWFYSSFPSLFIVALKRFGVELPEVF